MKLNQKIITLMLSGFLCFAFFGWRSSAESVQGPFNLVAWDSGSYVQLNWDIDSTIRVKGYNIYRSVKGPDHWEKLNTIVFPDTSFVDYSAPTSGLIFYKVNYVDLEGKEIVSASVVSISKSIDVAPSNAINASVAGFDKGNIITDSQLTKPGAMTAAQIQNFLGSQGSVLANYSSGNKTAAQRIYDDCQLHGISPQIVLVTLQKEKGLIKSSTANPDNYAMGWNTSDSTTSDFANQIYYGTRQFRLYYDNLGSYGWTVGQSHAVSDGTVAAANIATAGLYVYTPWIGQGGGGQAGVGGNYLFWDLWYNTFGFTSDTVASTVFPPTIIISKNSTSPYATSKNAFWVSDSSLAGQCTWYAYGRVIELSEGGYLDPSAATTMYNAFWGKSERDAKNWPSLLGGEWTSTNSSPLPLEKRKPGMLAVWLNGDHGHVGFVEEISADKTQYRLSDFNRGLDESYRNVWYNFEGTSDLLLGGYPSFYQLPLTNQTSTANYIGYIDKANCDIISGWAADKNRLNTSITVSIYADNQLIQTVMANGSRPDVGGVLGDNGMHGFTIATPANLKNNGGHSITARFETSNVSLFNSKTLNCVTGLNYVGYLDKANCDVISGWAADKNRPNTSINVNIYADNQLVQTVLANGSRPDVGSVLGDNGLHGFSIQTPAGLKNNGPHSITATFESSNTQLGNVKSLTCSTVPNYTGYLDKANCDVIYGWAADRNRLNTSINVSIYADNQLIQTVLANGSRPDVGSVLGDNGLHGFTIATPQSLKNNGAHTITATFESSNTQLGNVKSLNCSTIPNYAGYLDKANCDVIYGWAADKNRLNTPINVNIYADNQLIQTVTANGLRSDVGSVLGDNGLHGFTVATPANLKNNVSHSISATFETSGLSLGNSPKSIVCSTNPQVNSINPNPVPLFNANQSVQVFGNNFQTNLTVDVFNSGGTKVGTLSGSGQVQNVTSTSFTMVVFLGSNASTFGIEVVNPGGARSPRFTFSGVAPNPSVSSISPNPVPIFNGNQNVQVFGNNFQANLAVDVFNSSGTKVGTLSGSGQVQNVTANSFTMVIFLGNSAGTFGIEVVNPNGGRSPRFNFTY